MIDSAMRSKVAKFVLGDIELAPDSCRAILRELLREHDEESARRIALTGALHNDEARLYQDLLCAALTGIATHPAHGEDDVVELVANALDLTRRVYSVLTEMKSTKSITIKESSGTHSARPAAQPSANAVNEVKPNEKEITK